MVTPSVAGNVGRSADDERPSARASPRRSGADARRLQRRHRRGAARAAALANSRSSRRSCSARRSRRSSPTWGWIPDPRPGDGRARRATRSPPAEQSAPSGARAMGWRASAAAGLAAARRVRSQACAPEVRPEPGIQARIATRAVCAGATPGAAQGDRTRPGGRVRALRRQGGQSFVGGRASAARPIGWRRAVDGGATALCLARSPCRRCGRPSAGTGRSGCCAAAWQAAVRPSAWSGRRSTSAMRASPTTPVPCRPVRRWWSAARRPAPPGCRSRRWCSSGCFRPGCRPSWH